jgi:hypothetical protein
MCQSVEGTIVPLHESHQSAKLREPCHAQRVKPTVSGVTMLQRRRKYVSFLLHLRNEVIRATLLTTPHFTMRHFA